MQSPPSMPMRGPGGNLFSQQDNQQKHFMQDNIERKIEKFSSQNVGKRINTTSKFRSQPNAPMNNLQNGMSASHGPGSSGKGAGMLKKKLQPPASDVNSLNDSQQIEQSFQQKRPNTNAKHSKTQSFELNTVKMSMDKETPFQNEPDKQNKNINQIYDMLQRFAQDDTKEGPPQVILKENINF